MLSRRLLPLLVLLAVPAQAEEAAPAPEAIRAAAAQGIRWTREVAVEYTKQRECFSCHHQTSAVMTLRLAEQKGFPELAAARAQQIEHSNTSFAGRLDQLNGGRGIGGGATSVSYALLMHVANDSPRSEITDAMVHYLLKTQQQDGRWRSGGTQRPPSMGSDFASTALAILGLDRYAPEDQREAADAAIRRARSWLRNVYVQSTEDAAFRLLGLHAADADRLDIIATRSSVLTRQRADGGWPQTDRDESDAYATGTALVILHKTGLAVDDPAYQRGLAYLLRTQADDGAWHVVTRATPVQTYFDAGYPYEKDQFISYLAGAWATQALLYALPDREE